MKTNLIDQSLLFRKSRPIFLSLLLLVMIAMPLSAVSADSLHYAFTTIYINNLGDAGGGDCTNTAPGSVPAGAIATCDLRSAIAEANSGAGADVIELDDEAVRKIIAAGGTLEIVLAGNIPTITEELSLDLMYKNPNSGVESILPIKAAATHGGFVFSSAADSSSLTNVILQDMVGDGIRVLADDVTLSNITIEDTGPGPSAGYGVYVNGGNNASLSNMEISGHAEGVRFSSVDTALLNTSTIYKNTGDGVVIRASSTGVVVQNSFIGARVSPANVTTAAGNGGDGIEINNSYGNTINGNLISGNTGRGVFLTDSDAGVDNEVLGVIPDNIISNNKIGVDNKAETDVSNSAAGVYINGVPNTKIQSNVISANGSHGVDVRKLGSTGTSISGNKIGTDGLGESAIANSGNGVFIRTSKLVTVSSNLISGNTNGVYIRDDGANGSTEITVSNNTIGLEVDKQDALENTANGVVVLNSDTVTISGNYIGSNGSHGVSINGSDKVTLTSNKIGISVTSQLRGNGSNGVHVVNSTVVTIGGAGGSGGNTIVGNKRGVSSVDTENAVRILGNSIYSNTILDIDILNDGQTPNDTSLISGGDHVENYPVITNASIDINTGALTIDFTFDYGTPGEDYYFEFFYNNACSPTGFGGGKTFLTAQTYAAYSATFPGEVRETIVIPAGSVPAGLGEGSVITALVTNDQSTGGYFDTSEFSACEYVLSSGIVGTSSHLIVNRLGNQSATAAALIAGVCDIDDGTSGSQCTLRAAVQTVNADVNTYDIYTITFSFLGSAPFKIQENSTLTLTHPVIIDATSAYFNNDPQVVLDGPGSGTNRIGLDIQANDSKVIGLIFVNYAEGIRLSGADNATVRNNYMGIHPDGTEESNKYGLVLIGATNSSISNNTISANLSGGAVIQNSTGNSFDSNYVGTNDTGASPRGNFGPGIFISGGATNVVSNNVVADNAGYGIGVITSTSNQITNNQIGGSNALGNTSDGIIIQADNTTVTDNTISYNLGDGVNVDGGTGNLISENYISNNGDNPAQDFRIDLNGDAATANDAGDGDSGANNTQNYPDLTSATAGSTYTYIEGSLDSTANTAFTIEFYANNQFIGSLAVTTDSGGAASVGYVHGSVLATLTEITALAFENATGNTSEFSPSNAIYVLTGTVPTLTPLPSATATNTSTPSNTPLPTNTTAPGASTATSTKTNTPTKTSTVASGGGSLPTKTPVPPTSTGNPTTTAIAATLTQLASSGTGTATQNSGTPGTSTVTATYAFSFASATHTATDVPPTATTAPTETLSADEGTGGGVNEDLVDIPDGFGTPGVVPTMMNAAGNFPLEQQYVMATLEAQAAIEGLPGVDYSNPEQVAGLIAAIQATNEAASMEAAASEVGGLPMSLILSVCGGLLLLILLIFGGMELWKWLNSRED